MRDRKKKYCICCPECGKFFCRSGNMDSEFICSKCKKKIVAIVSDGRVITFPEQREEDGDLPVAAEM